MVFLSRSSNRSILFIADYGHSIYLRHICNREKFYRPESRVLRVDESFGERGKRLHLRAADDRKKVPRISDAFQYEISRQALFSLRGRPVQRPVSQAFPAEVRLFAHPFIRFYAGRIR